MHAAELTLLLDADFSEDNKHPARSLELVLIRAFTIPSFTQFAEATPTLCELSRRAVPPSIRTLIAFHASLHMFVSSSCPSPIHRIRRADSWIVQTPRATSTTSRGRLCMNFNTLKLSAAVAVPYLLELPTSMRPFQHH